MATGTLVPSPVFCAVDEAGNPIVGGKLYTTLAGTTSALAAYRDANLTIPHTNPIVLDGSGRAVIYLGPYAYRLELHDADDALVWTVDPVEAVAPYSVDLDIDGVAGEALSAFDIVYLSGGDTGTTPGRWYKTDADDTNKSSLAPMVGLVPGPIAQGAVGTIRLQGRVDGMTALNAGAVYYCSATSGRLTSSPPTNKRLVGIADSTTSLVLFSSAVGNQIAVSGIGFTPIESVGGQGAIIATINASTESGGTLRIGGNKIQINGSVTFAAGYDPSAKVPAGGAAADVNAGVTTISGAQITTGTVTADKIAADSITSTQIAAGTITGTDIAAATITADKLTIASLSAITANLGTVTAGSITGVTISGSTIIAGAGGEVVLNNLGITVARNTTGSDTGSFNLAKAYSFTFAAGGGGYGGMWLFNPSTSDQTLIVESASTLTGANQNRVIIRAMGGLTGSAITIGSGTGGDITVQASDRLTLIGAGIYTQGSILPTVTSSYNLGDATARFGECYLTLPVLTYVAGNAPMVSTPAGRVAVSSGLEFVKTLTGAAPFTGNISPGGMFLNFINGILMA